MTATIIFTTAPPVRLGTCHETMEWYAAYQGHDAIGTVWRNNPRHLWSAEHTLLGRIAPKRFTDQVEAAKWIEVQE